MNRIDLRGMVSSSVNDRHVQCDERTRQGGGSGGGFVASFCAGGWRQSEARSGAIRNGRTFWRFGRSPALERVRTRFMPSRGSTIATSRI